MPSVHSKEAVQGMRQKLQRLEKTGISGLKSRAKMIVTYADAILVLKIELGAILVETKQFLKDSKLKLTFGEFLKSEEYCNDALSSSDAGRCIDVYTHRDFLKKKFGDDFANRISMNAAIAAVYELRKKNKAKLDKRIALHDDTEWVADIEKTRDEKAEKKEDNRAKRELDKKADEKNKQAEVDSQHNELQEAKNSINKMEDVIEKVCEKIEDLALREKLEDSLLHSGDAKKNLEKLSESLPPESKPSSRKTSPEKTKAAPSRPTVASLLNNNETHLPQGVVQTGDILVKDDEVNIGVTPSSGDPDLGPSKKRSLFSKFTDMIGVTQPEKEKYTPIRRPRTARKGAPKCVRCGKPTFTEDLNKDRICKDCIYLESDELEEVEI